MGKKGQSWFSAIKKVFTSSSKDKQPPTSTNNEGDKVSLKQKKGGGLGRLKSRSLFIPPRFREPSSIEKILGEIDQQNIFIPPLQQPQLQPQPSSSYSERPVSPTPPHQQPQAQSSSSYSERPVSPTTPHQQPQAQPSSSYCERPVSPPQQSQAQPSSSTSARPVSPPQQPQAQPSSSSSARPVSPPQQPQAQPSSSTSARPVSPPPQQPQAQPSTSTSARHVPPPPPPQQSQAQPSSSYSERPLSPPPPPPPPPPQQSKAQLSSSSAKPVSPPQVITPPKSGLKTPPPQVSSSPKAGIKTPPPRFVHSQTQISRRPKPTLQQQHLSAIRIQASYRGHMVRRNVKGLTGLVRLQGVVRGHNVKRQTVNAMKQMQLLVRVQTQIQSRRIQTLENQALKRQADNNNDKSSATSLGNKRTEMGDEYWDFSSITKEERDARSQKKVEALIRRERTLAYAHSHKVRKGTPTSAQNSLMDVRTGGYPWWWNWLDRQLPNNTPQPLKNLLATTPSRSGTPDDKRTQKQLDRLDSPSTPMSSRSVAPPSRSRTPPSRMMKYSRASRGGGSPFSIKDDDSLMSCPQFSSVPNYMSPTVSAKAKARPTTSSNPKDRVSPSPSTPGSETSKRRFSFPFTPNSNKWKKSPSSIGGMSIDSSISVSSSVARKPFNRFV